MLGGSRRNDKILKLTKLSENTPKKTDLSDIWSKPLDFNDFNVIFNHQHRNEYYNSFRFIQSYDLSPLKRSIKNVQLEAESCPESLYCEEQLLPSDNEDDVTVENLGNFFDSDDSVKDKDYIPDSYESCNSDEENVGKLAKLKNDHLLSGKRQKFKTKQTDINNCYISAEKKIKYNTHLKETQKHTQVEENLTNYAKVIVKNSRNIEKIKNKAVKNRETIKKDEGKSEELEKRATENIILAITEHVISTTEDEKSDLPAQEKEYSILPLEKKVKVTEQLIRNQKTQLNDNEFIQEDYQNYSITTATKDDDKNGRPLQEDKISNQQLQENVEIMEEIYKGNEKSEKDKSSLPAHEREHSVQKIQQKDNELIQKGNQNNKVPTTPKNNELTMEKEKNDLLSQEDKISDQGSQENENIVEEISTPRISETDYEIIDPMTGSEVHVSLTKSGKPRQRRRFTETKEERILKKVEEKREKLAIKISCQESCKKKCITMITEDQRREIHDSYVNMNYEEQGIFIKCMINEKPVQRRLVTSAAKRQTTLVYHLKVDNTLIEVCKTFFLSTLGYNAKNDCRVRSAMKKPLHDQKTKRGSYERTNKIDRQIIEDHIKTFNPCISHYRREHAPNKLYLPSDITITSMHEQFCLQYPNLKVSQELYRLVIKQMNISFARLGHEECEQCTVFANHNPNHNKDNIMNEACDDCLNYVVHKFKYTESRTEYQNDGDNATVIPNDVFYSVDLQKVIMLPRLDQYKTAIFCSRIIAFNESFVPIGKQNEPHVPFAAVWNETISGRNQEDIISAFKAFLMHKRDAENITLWLDNCAAQNKNWTLLSFLVQIVNSDLIAAKTIILKYFETGHTFMSADSFHHQVEMALKRMDKVYDFFDYVDCVRSANSKKNFVKIMDVSDFFDYRDYTSQHKLRKNEPRIYLKDMVAIKVERGHYTLKFKESHTDGVFQTLDFLQTKIIKTQVFPETSAKTEPRGINEERKKAIIAKLVPLMPENRRKYWCDLPVSDAKDLTQTD